MQSRRGFAFKVAAGFVAMALVVVGGVLADELIGVITKVHVDDKKLTVVEEGTEKEIEVKVTDETEQVTKKGARKIDLEKFDGRLKKMQENGRKGIRAKITHEKGVASKIEFPRKKAE